MPRACKKTKCSNYNYSQNYMPENLYNNEYRQVFSGQFTNPYVPSLNNANENMMIRDHGPEPFVVNIEEITKLNNTFRTALWTGDHMQLTLMSINVGEDIGLEIHPHLDQFLRIEEGQGMVMMGDDKNNLNFQRMVRDDFAIIIPAGTWHNLVNTGNIPIKLYSIYAPPQHPHGTVHLTKADAEAAEHMHNY